MLELQIVTYATFKRMVECAKLRPERARWLPPPNTMAETAYIYGGYLSRWRRLLRWLLDGERQK